MRILILILVFPCSRMPESPCRTISTISYGLQGCIVFCTQKTTFLGYGKPPRMPLLCSKNNTRMPFWENRQKQTFLDRRRPQKDATATQTEFTSQALFQVHKSKHLCCRTAWNNLSAPTEKKTKAELEKEAWASPDDPSLEDLPLPPIT